MPEVAADTPEALLTSWPIAENQPYVATDVIVTVETAKAAVDVEAEADGLIIKMLVEPGTNVQVGDAIALIGTPGESVDDIDAALANLGVSVPNRKIGPSVPPSGTTPIHADGPDATTEPEATPPAGGVDTTPSLEGHAATRGTTEPCNPTNTDTDLPSTRLFASPLARRMARDAGLTFDGLTGSGPHGRIVRRDVQLAVTQQTARPASTTPTPTVETSRPTVSAPLPTSAPASPPAAAGYTDLPLSKLRRLIARRLTESKSNIPHFYLSASVRFGAVLTLRQQLNAVSAAKVSVNDMIVKAVACAYQAVPAANAIWAPDAVRRFETVDLGIAVAVEAGLVTPVLRGVDTLSLTALAATTRDVAERARAGKLKQDELEGGTATISNLGMFATESFSAIINPPQSAILAVGAARLEPVVTAKGRVKVDTVLHMTVSVDHRAIDGALAAQWLQALVTIIEDPLRIVA